MKHLQQKNFNSQKLRLFNSNKLRLTMNIDLIFKMVLRNQRYFDLISMEEYIWRTFFLLLTSFIDATLSVEIKGKKYGKMTENRNVVLLS